MGCWCQIFTGFPLLIFRPASDYKGVGGLQGQVPAHPGAGGSATVPGVDLPQPEEAVAGQGRGG